MSISTPEWVKDAIFYQIFPDRFAKSARVPKQGLNLETWESAPTPYGFKGGDLLGVAEKLDYLQELGITAIYFNPVFASASNHRYHTYDYFNVDPLLGGNAALRELLDAAHARGIRVVLDGVFNHASRGFWPFHHTLENGAGSPYRDWFHFDHERLYGKRNWGAYPTPEEEKAIHSQGSLKAIGYQAWWDLPALPKFNTEVPAVREYIFSVAEYWIRFGLDGWRLDVPAEINDDGFWQEFRRRVKAINPEAYIVGEIWDESRRWLQGDQFDAVMNYPVTIALLGFLAGPRLDMKEANRAGGYSNKVQPFNAKTFARHIDEILAWYDPEITQAQFNLLDSHDTPRFLTCASGDKAAFKLALLFLLAYPGAPSIYYGDEIGLEGRHDPDCRRSFPWDEAQWDKDMLAYTRACIALRKAHPALRRGSYHGLYADREAYAFARQLGDETLLVALNSADTEHTLEIPRAALGSLSANPAIVFGEAGVSLAQEVIRLTLKPRSAIVLKG